LLRRVACVQHIAPLLEQTGTQGPFTSSFLVDLYIYSNDEETFKTVSSFTKPMKRGQVTIFILIGIVILIAAVLIIYVFIVRGIQPESERQQAVVLSAETAEVEQYMISCLERVTENAAYAIALHGGYLNALGSREWGEPGDGVNPKSHFFLGDFALPAVVDGMSKTLRTLSDMERLMEKYIIVELHKCAELSYFSEQFTIQQPSIDWQAIDFDFTQATVAYSVFRVSSSVKIAPESITSTVSYPLLLTRDSNRFELNTFTVQIPLRLGLLHKIANDVTEEIKNDESYLIASKCDDYAAHDGLVNIYLISNPTRKHDAVRIVDAQPTINKFAQPLAFQFAVKNVEVTGECVG